MDIKDTIKQLGLENEKFPRILNQRVNTVTTLQNKLIDAQDEYESDKTDENEQKLNEIKEYVDEYTDDVVNQLKAYKRKLEKAKENDGNDKVDDPKKEEKEEKDKKENGGWGGLLIGGVLLVATLGAVNILNKK